MDHVGRRDIMTRRLLLAGAAAIASGRTAHAALPVPSGNKLNFRLMRHGAPIGTHMMTFRGDGDVLIVDIAVDVLVKFGPIPLVRYAHRNQETWQHRPLGGI